MTNPIHFNPNPDDNESVERITKDLSQYPKSVANVPNNPSFSVVYDAPIARPANVKDVGNRNYNSQTGIPLSHPLELMTLIVNENCWADLAVKTISSACAGTDPLFQVYSKANGRNKSVKSNRKMEVLIEKLMFPNLQQTGYELFLATYESLAVYSNAYWQIVRNKKGEIHSIYSLPAESMRIIPFTDEWGILHTAYYQYDLIGNNKNGNIYLEHEIIHFKDTNEKSFLYGKPRLYSLMGHIIINNESLNSIQSWFSECFSAGAIFSIDADSEVMARNREFLRDNYAGSKNYGKALLLEGSTKLVDNGAKYVGNVNFQSMASIGRDTILSCMGVPVSMAGVRSDAGQGNAEVIASEEKAFKRSTVDRLHSLVFGKIQQQLIRGMMEDDDLVIKAGVLSKFNTSDEADQVRALSTIGISIGEAREILGMRALENDVINKQMVILTNNGAARLEDIIGINPEDGSKIETIFERQFKLQEMQAEAQVKISNDKMKGNGTTTTSDNGLGGALADAASGK